MIGMDGFFFRPSYLLEVERIKKVGSLGCLYESFLEAGPQMTLQVLGLRF